MEFQEELYEAQLQADEEERRLQELEREVSAAFNVRLNAKEKEKWPQDPKCLLFHISSDQDFFFMQVFPIQLNVFYQAGG